MRTLDIVSHGERGNDNVDRWAHVVWAWHKGFAHRGLDQVGRVARVARPSRAEGQRARTVPPRVGHAPPRLASHAPYRPSVAVAVAPAQGGARAASAHHMPDMVGIVHLSSSWSLSPYFVLFQRLLFLCAGSFCCVPTFCSPWLGPFCWRIYFFFAIFAKKTDAHKLSRYETKRKDREKI